MVNPTRDEFKKMRLNEQLAWYLFYRLDSTATPKPKDLTKWIDEFDDMHVCVDAVLADFLDKEFNHPSPEFKAAAINVMGDVELNDAVREDREGGWEH